jgi:hypothetical protein
MSGPRDYAAFVQLVAALVPIDSQALESDRSVGGYLALRVAADQFLHSGQHAFDMDFYRDERADGGVSTRLVGAYAKMTVERYFAHGALDLPSIHTAILHDQLLRVPHGEKIELQRASLNAIALLRGMIRSRRPVLEAPAPEIEFPVSGGGR